MTCRIPQFALLLLASIVLSANADPLAPPGDLLLRHDIRLLVDEGVLNIPVTAWPVPWGDIFRQLDPPPDTVGSRAIESAIDRLRNRARQALDAGSYAFSVWGSVAAEPRVIRTFEDTPREDGEAGLALSWTGNRFAFKFSAAYVDDPVDGDEFRPDDSYVGAVLGNWMVTAGWQQRWWGPGNDASSILSTNARPRPGIALQRNLSLPFESKWLRWIGPWSLTAFMQHLDDERERKDPLLWGFRFDFRPLPSLELGVNRTAMWCGEDRPCDFSTFLKAIAGKDNRGDNVTFEDEPGNQMAGYDIRWSLPKRIPIALYMQWTAEDGRGQGVPLGSYLRMVGMEFWGEISGLSHRTHVEVAETICREGGFGFSDKKPNCAYNAPLYPVGYRYNSRPMGHGIDADGRSYSLGSTLVQSAGHTWNISIRFMEINREGQRDPRHSLSPTPQDRADIQISHERLTRFGKIHAGVGFSHIDDKATNSDTSDITGFIRWTSR